MAGTRKHSNHHKNAAKRTQRRPNKPAAPSRPERRDSGAGLFEAILLLPVTHMLAPLSSFLVFLVATFLRGVTGLVRGGLLLVGWGISLLLRTFVLRPLRAVYRVWRRVTGLLGRLFRLPRSEARELRASMARLEHRLKATEHQLHLHQKHLQRLQQQQQQQQQQGNVRAQERTSGCAPVAVSSAPIAAPLPPPPPPPAPMPPSGLPFRLPAKDEAARLNTAIKKKGSTIPAPVISMQDLLRVKLRPTQQLSVDQDSTSENAGLPWGEKSSGAPLAVLKGKQAAKGLSVSLADITNVQLRRAQRPPSGLSVRATGSSPRVGFKLRRVEGIERSPGGTPIRTEFAKSSHNNTTDKFAMALKKKFESSLINSPPRSASSSPISSPIAPGTPHSLNGSFVSASLNITTCYSPSASFFADSSAPSPIRADVM